ncbi:hypothetical protein GA0074695_1873 [Micromonospora viridifaciens]|uniref:LTXXQ motif family protein n=1 Tax=Micromonospora viridifaciens TaxID=1881 RepID=A0A1C4VWQ7_MICVI|nr:hypothetical protein [Micromonospora viridifaciens]SCE88400.1 hypothetical protein GA0074695_1873 [Micromonospora viridifaciens]
MIRKMSRKHVLVGLAAAGVLGVGIAAPTVALADDKSPSPSASASADQGTDRQQRRADRQAEFAEALAKELGVSTDKVTAALEKLKEQHKGDRPERPSTEDRQEWQKDRQDWQKERQAQLKERLDQAVKDGKLTQEQADAVLKAVEAGVFPGPGGQGHHGGWGGRAGK